MSENETIDDETVDEETQIVLCCPKCGGTSINEYGRTTYSTPVLFFRNGPNGLEAADVGDRNSDPGDDEFEGYECMDQNCTWVGNISGLIPARS